MSFLGEKGTLFNLSANGCAVESKRSVQRGVTMTLKLYLPSLTEPLNVQKVKVMWTAGKDFGVEFISVDAKERERLDRIISDLQQSTQRGTKP